MPLKRTWLLPATASFAVCGWAIAATLTIVVWRKPLAPPPVESSFAVESVPQRELPTYIIEPPDILWIQSLVLKPRPTHLIEPGDSLEVLGENSTPPRTVVVDPEGFVTLATQSGHAQVAGMTIAEAQAALAMQLAADGLDTGHALSISLGPINRQFAADRLVAPDGTINLGLYGTLYVSGLTVAEVKAAVENRLLESLAEVKVSVDVYAYNSKVYYLVDETGSGTSISRMPITGNETVLDALVQPAAPEDWRQKNVWLARPTVRSTGGEVLPVYSVASSEPSVFKNYQVLPGDRILVSNEGDSSLRR